MFSKISDKLKNSDIDFIASIKDKCFYISLIGIIGLVLCGFGINFSNTIAATMVNIVSAILVLGSFFAKGKSKPKYTYFVKPGEDLAPYLLQQQELKLEGYKCRIVMKKPSITK